MNELQNDILNIVANNVTNNDNSIPIIKSYSIKGGDNKSNKGLVVIYKGNTKYINLGSESCITRDSKGREKYEKIASKIGGDKELRDYICSKSLPSDTFNFKDIKEGQSIHYNYCQEYDDNGITYLNLFNKQDILDTIKKRTPNLINKDYSLIEYYLKTMFKDSYTAICNFIQYRRKNIFNLVPIGFVLTGSRQVGKSSFYNVLLSEIFGDSNMATPIQGSEVATIGGDSHWKGKPFVLFDEFTIDAKIDPKKVTEELKKLITAPHVSKKVLYKDVVKIDHFSTYIFTSNKVLSMFIEDIGVRYVYLDLQEDLFLPENKDKISEFSNQIPAFLEFLDNEFPTPKFPKVADFKDCMSNLSLLKSDGAVLYDALVEYYTDPKYRKNQQESQVVEVVKGNLLKKTHRLTLNDKEKIKQIYFENKGEAQNYDPIFKNNKTLAEGINEYIPKMSNLKAGDMKLEIATGYQNLWTTKIKIGVVITIIQDDNIKEVKEEVKEEVKQEVKEEVKKEVKQEIIIKEIKQEVDLVVDMGVDEEEEERLWINTKPTELRDAFYCIKRYYYITMSGQELIKGIKLLRDKTGECTTSEMIQQMKQIALLCAGKMINLEVQ